MTSSVTSHKEKMEERVGRRMYQQCMTVFDVAEFRLYHLCCTISKFDIPSWAYNERGHVTDLTLGDLHEKSETYKM